jgi:hypothetical protein
MLRAWPIVVLVALAGCGGQTEPSTASGGATASGSGSGSGRPRPAAGWLGGAERQPGVTRHEELLFLDLSAYVSDDSKVRRARHHRTKHFSTAFSLRLHADPTKRDCPPGLSLPASRRSKADGSPSRVAPLLFRTGCRDSVPKHRTRRNPTRPCPNSDFEECSPISAKTAPALGFRHQLEGHRVRGRPRAVLPACSPPATSGMSEHDRRPRLRASSRAQNRHFRWPFFMHYGMCSLGGAS